MQVDQRIFHLFYINQGDAKHLGAEFYSLWNFKTDWYLETTKHIKATISSFTRDLANSPKYQYSFLIKYSPKNRFYSNISINGSDDYFEENGHDLKRESYSIVNAVLGYKSGNWDISLWAKNLFNHNYTKRLFYFDNYHPDDNYSPNSKRLYKAYADPLNYGLTINYDW